MKLKFLLFTLSLILILGLLAGCTPKTQETEDSYTLPGLESGSDKLPENESGQAAPSQPDEEPDGSDKDPIASELDSGAPAIETGDPEQPGPAESGSEERPTETDAPDAEPTEDPDDEIEDDIIVTVDGDFGVGGN